MPQAASAKDVAKYIIKLSQDIGEPVTNMKLQKLLYYSYVWYLVEKGMKRKLFKEPIVAWKYGPIVKDVYSMYKKYGADVIRQAENGNIENLDEEAKNIIEDVFKVYGAKNGIELANLTHNEQPWIQSYEEDEENIIPDNLIFTFYKSLQVKTA